MYRAVLKTIQRVLSLMFESIPVLYAVQSNGEVIQKSSVMNEHGSRGEQLLGSPGA